MSDEKEFNLGFDEWLAGFQGSIASCPDILHLESYQDILKERLKAAYIAGAASVVSSDQPAQ